MQGAASSFPISLNGGEAERLLPTAGLVVTAQVKAANGIVIKVLSNGAAYFLQAVNSIGNSVIFNEINVVEAASLLSSFQSFARNVFSGMLNAPGQMLATARGENSGENNGGNPKEIRELIIASYSLTVILASASSLLYVIAYFSFPHLGYSSDTAKSACDFVFYTGFAIWPTLMLTTLGQIAYASGFWKSSLITSLMNRIPAIIGSYFLAVTAGWLTTGIAVANLAAPWLVYLAMEFWMRHQAAFRDVFTSSTDRNQQPEFQTIMKQLKTMFILSLKVGFQRCTEWLNALAITMILGAMIKSSLRSMNPALNAIALWSLFSQGIGTGANMIVAKLIKQLEKAKEQNKSKDEQAEIYKQIKSVIVKRVMEGVVINSVVGAAMYAARTNIVKCLIDNPSPQTQQTAENLLGVVGLGLVADAIRLIVSTVLTAFNKPLQPNAVSLSLMSFGIAIGFLISLGQSDSFKIMSIFACRSATISLSALANLYTTYCSVVGLHAAIDKKIAAQLLVAQPVRKENTTATAVNVSVNQEEEEEVAAPPQSNGLLLFFTCCKDVCISAYCRFFGARVGTAPAEAQHNHFAHG